MNLRATLIGLCILSTASAWAGGVDSASDLSAPSAPLVVWYRKPAGAWTEALPVGNGRIAAMVFGGVNQERLQLNEGTLWAGGPYDPNNPDALDVTTDYLLGRSDE